MTRPMLLRCVCLAWLLTAAAGCKWSGTSFMANSNGAIPMLNFSFVPRQSEPPVLPSGTEKAPDPIRQVAHEEDERQDEKIASKKTTAPPKLAGKEPDEDEGEDMLNLSDDEPEPTASKSKTKSRGNPLTKLFGGRKKAPRVPLPRTDKDDDEDEPDPRDKLNM